MKNAKDRISSLLDPNSFVELGARVTARSTDFNPGAKKAPSDGVVTGYGLIDNHLIYIYAQDPSVLGGSIGEMHAKKIIALYKLAISTGAPILGLLDSIGLRLEEGTDALHAFAGIYQIMSKASGLIPQMSVVYGKCGGGLALIPSLSDFTFMAKDAELFVNSPNALTGNVETNNDTSLAQAKATSGNVDFVGDETEIIDEIHKLMAVLPANNEDHRILADMDDLNRSSENTDIDPKLICQDLADSHVFLETKQAYAKDMITGLLRLGGHTTAIIANNDSSLTSNGCRKATRLVRFADAFDLPIITLTNVNSFATNLAEEDTIALAAAELAEAFADATCPKINVIIQEAMGSAYAVMNPQADFTMAFPDAKLGMMAADLAAKIVADKDDDLSEVTKSYDSLQNSIEMACERGYIDQIIEPIDLRRHLIGALEVLYSKRKNFQRKHATI